MPSINEIFAVVTLLVQIEQGKPIGTGTGFFYGRGDRIYLITNRHIVRDEQKSVKPDILRLRLHSDPSDLSKNVDFDVPLYQKNTARWHVHPKYPNPPIDIAVIELDEAALKKGHFFRIIGKDVFLPEKFVVRPAQDVMVIGYPRGLSDPTHNLPIVRNAMVSSVYGVDFGGSPFFLVDATLHPGMSGSPVFTKPQNMWPDDQGNISMMTGSPTFFLGVHSATLNLNLPSGIEPLGLGTVWYAKLIEETIDSFQNK